MNPWAAQSREISISGEITPGTGERLSLTGDDVLSFTISEGADSVIVPGDVLSAQLDMTLNDTGRRWSGIADRLTGATLRLAVSAGGEAEPLGVFQLTQVSVREGEGTVRVTGADSISFELGGVYAETVTYPAALGDIWAAAVAQTRYTGAEGLISGGPVIPTAPDFGGATIRAVLGAVAAVNGCFVCADRSGSLSVRGVRGDPAYTVTGEQRLSMELGWADYGPVDALRVTSSGGEGTVYDTGSAVCVLEMSGNPLVESAAAARHMLDRVAGYATRQAEFSFRGDPALRPGDRVILAAADGSEAECVLSRQVLEYSQGFRADCVCAVPEDMDTGLLRAITPEGGLNAARLTGAVNGALLSVGSVTANKLAAGSVTAEKLAAGAVDAQTLTALTAAVGSMTAQSLETDALAAALARFAVIAAGSAEFDAAAVRHLTSSLLQVEDAGAGNVFIDNLLVRYAQLVTAVVGSLVLRAADGRYYRMDVSGGAVSAVDVTDTLSDSELSAGITETGRAVVETQISADRLAAGDFKAMTALIGSVYAEMIDADKLFARQAFIDRLNTADISSNTSVQQSIRSVTDDRVERFMRLDDEGLHVGRSGAAGEVVIDEDSVAIRTRGALHAEFGSGSIRFGDYELRRSADGGLVFKMRE